MKITDALLGEHAILYVLFDRLEKNITETDSLEAAHRAADMLAESLISHARLEEEVLFPALAPHLGPMGPLQVMQAEHQEIEAAFEDILKNNDLKSVKGRIRSVIETTRMHFEKEEEILFGMAADCLDIATLTQLGKRWSELRRVHIP